MDRVRKKLLAEKAKVEGIEERRRVREMKKYGKEIQRQKEKEKHGQKRATLDAVKQWKKDGGGDMDDGFIKSLDKPASSSSSSSSKNQNPSRKRKSPKQQGKDDKYGYGGPKKRAKKNSVESTNSMQGFSLKKNRSVPSDLVNRLPKGQQKKHKGTQKRPGKNKRRTG